MDYNTDIFSFENAAEYAGFDQSVSDTLYKINNAVNADMLVKSFFEGLPRSAKTDNLTPGARLGFYPDGFYPESTLFTPAKAAFDRVHVPYQVGFLAVFLAISTKTYTRYKEYSLPEALFFDSLAKIGKHAKVCFEKNGFYGIEDYVWDCQFLAPTLFAVGNIECKLCEFDGKRVFVGGRTVMPKEPVIQVHIPQGADISPTALNENYAMACRLFGTDVFYLDSWLLYPPHKQVLSEDSSIRKMMNAYTLLSVSESMDYEGLFRVFGKNPGTDLSALPKETGLQRFYIDRIRQNMPCGSGIGIMRFDGQC